MTRLRFRRREFEVALCPLRPTIDVGQSSCYYLINVLIHHWHRHWHQRTDWTIIRKHRHFKEITMIIELFFSPLILISVYSLPALRVWESKQRTVLESFSMNFWPLVAAHNSPCPCLRKTLWPANRLVRSRLTVLHWIRASDPPFYVGSLVLPQENIEKRLLYTKFLFFEYTKGGRNGIHTKEAEENLQVIQCYSK